MRQGIASGLPTTGEQRSQQPCYTHCESAQNSIGTGSRANNPLLGQLFSMISIKNLVGIIKSIGSKHEWEGNGFVVTLKSQWLVEYKETDDHRVAELVSEPLVGGDEKMHRAVYLQTLKWKLDSERVPASDEDKKLIAARIKEALIHLEPSAELISE